MKRPSFLHVGGTLYWVMNTRNPDTQVLKDADSTPTVAIRKNGASTGDSVTVTKRAATTGIYDCSYNPAGEVEGDEFTVEESATVTGTTTGSATYRNSWEFSVIAVERGTDSALTTLGANAPAGWLNAAAFASGAFDAVWAVGSRTLTAFGFNVTVGTNNDKTGYSLSAAGVQAIWDALASTLTAVGSIGKLLVDNINATISSRASQSSVDGKPTLTQIEASTVLAKEATVSSRASQTSVDDIPTVAEFNARTIAAADYATASGITNIQGRLPSALVGGRMDASVGAMAANVLTASALAADAVTEIQTGLSTLDAAGVRSAIGLAIANLDTQLADIPTVAEFNARTIASADYATDTDVSAAVLSIQGTQASNAQTGAAAALAAYDPPTYAEMLGRTLLASEYATATNLTAVKNVTDKIDTMVELDGLVYRYTTNALEQAPAGGGGGGTDWTADERIAIRSILGIPISGTTPEDPSTGILDTIRDSILSTVYVYPLSAEDSQRENGTALAFAQRSTKSRTIRIFDNTQTPVDLSPLTLRFVVKDLNGNVIMRVEDANLTVSGVDNSYVTVPVSIAATRNVGTYRYALIAVNDGNNPLTEGDWVVYYSANV